MEKIISRKQHGFTDYGYVPFVAAAPELVGFAEEKTASFACRAISAAVLATSLMTRAEWGAAKLIPFKTHCIMDIALGAGAMAAPMMLGFSRNKAARNTFLIMGAFGVLAGLLSDWQDEMPLTKKG